MRFYSSPNIIKRKIRKYIKNFAKLFKIEIQRYSKFNDSEVFFREILKRKDINIVYDIGANIGLFSLFLRDINYKQKIICFEPVQEAYSQLKKNLKNYDVKIHPPSAIGDLSGNININVSINTGCSSILPMLDSHKRISKKSYYKSVEEVKLITLDEIYKDYLKKDSRLLLKIDTQGYEFNVLKGARKTLEKCEIILIELQVRPLYEGQKLWEEMINLLNEYGFDLWHLEKVTKDPNNHRLLELDGIFLKR
tara:strand:- start:4654 stop:5406 length:753 start_codon:yes stop_codon:yes gene_type:complete